MEKTITQIHEKPSTFWKTYANHACTSVVSIYTEPDKKRLNVLTW